MKIDLQLNEFWSVAVKVTFKKQQYHPLWDANSLTKTWFWVPNWKVTGLIPTKKCSYGTQGKYSQTKQHIIT